MRRVRRSRPTSFRVTLSPSASQGRCRCSREEWIDFAVWMSFAAAFHACIIPKAHPKQESDLLKPGRLGGGAADQGAANAIFSMREISPSGWIGQQAKGGGGFAAGKRAPRRCAPTKTVHIPLLKAARRGGYAGCGFAPRIELAFGDSASLRGDTRARLSELTERRRARLPETKPHIERQTSTKSQERPFED